jgi:hypothetical protein
VDDSRIRLPNLFQPGTRTHPEYRSPEYGTSRPCAETSRDNNEHADAVKHYHPENRIFVRKNGAARLLGREVEVTTHTRANRVDSLALARWRNEVNQAPRM